MAAAKSKGPARPSLLMRITLALAVLVLVIFKLKPSSPVVFFILIPATILLYFLALPGKRERREERRARTAKIVQDALK